MQFTIICPKPDFAGTNIAEELKKFKIPLIEPEERSIFLENIDKEIEKTDFIIFATTHRGKKEKILSVHAPGNWDKAELGGKEGEVCPTSSFVLKVFFQELVKNTPEGWGTTMEVTHHGPYLETPCLFIEIGSNESDWKQKEAGIAIAKTIKESIERIKKEKQGDISAILIGGGHYNHSAVKVMLRTNYAVGHIIPEHMLEFIDENMIHEALTKTLPHPEIVLLDWKGLGSHKKKVVDLLEKMNLKSERVQRL